MNSSFVFRSVLTIKRFPGGRPKENNGNGFKTQDRSTTEGCSFQCVKDEPDQCKSFGIRQKGFDEEHGVSAQVC